MEITKAQESMGNAIKTLHTAWRHTEDPEMKEKTHKALLEVSKVYDLFYDNEASVKLMNELEEMVHFYNKLNGKFLGGYSVRGTFRGELQSTLELKAYDNNISIDDIEVRYETQYERLENGSILV